MHTVDTPPTQDALTQTSQRIRVIATVTVSGGKPRIVSLSQPVSLIGSRRHAQIVVREDAVGRSHAAIINTGCDVLLIDLLGKTGTMCQDQAVDLTVLRDGDVIRVGSASIQVAISSSQPAGPNEPLTFEDPLVMPRRLRLVRVDTGQDWDIRASAAVIGSRTGAAVCIEDPEVARAHSLIFATTRGIGICDLGSSRPLKINGKEQPMAYLRRQDRLLIGRVGFMVDLPNVERRPVGDAAAPRAIAALGDRDRTLQGKFAALQQEMVQQQEQLARREQQVHDREIQLRKLAQELEDQTEWVQQQSRRFETAEYEMSTRRAALEQHHSDLDYREAELEARCSELSRLADELDSRRSEIETFSAQYDQRRQELADQRAALEDQRRDLELERQMLRERSAEIDATGRAVAERHAELEINARALTERSDRLALQSEKLELEQQSLCDARRVHQEQAQRLAVREQQLKEYEQSLQVHAQALSTKEQELCQRSAVVQQFSAFLEQANQAYRIAADPLAVPRRSQVPGMPGAAVPAEADDDEAPIQEAAEVIARTHRKMHTTVQQLQDQTTEMMMMIAESSAGQSGTGPLGPRPAVH